MSEGESSWRKLAEQASPEQDSEKLITASNNSRECCPTARPIAVLTAPKNVTVNVDQQSIP
jgi:hypothetical protein